MGVWTLFAIWHFLFSWATVANLIGSGAVAVAVFLPNIISAIVPHLRTLAIYVAIAAFSFSSVAGKFYNDGLVVKQTEWNRALAAETKQGKKDLSDAKRDVDSSNDAGSVRNDKWNRDSGK